MSDINPPVIPVALQRIFEDAGFIGAAQDGYKPNIRAKYYTQADSWVGWALRHFHGENADKTKLFVRNTCEAMSQALEQYKSTKFRAIILEKMIRLRIGVSKIVETYKSDINAKAHLEDSILILDMCIPEEIKIKYGFVVGRELPIPEDTKSSPVGTPLHKGDPISAHKSPETDSYSASVTTHPSTILAHLQSRTSPASMQGVVASTPGATQRVQSDLSAVTPLTLPPPIPDIPDL